MQPLPSGGQLVHAAIVGHDGGVWAQDASFPAITDDEVAALMRGMNDAGALAQTGVRIGGEKYMMVAGEPGEVIRGKKGPGGVTVKKTVGALVIGIYGEGVGHGECNVVSVCVPASSMMVAMLQCLDDGRVRPGAGLACSTKVSSARRCRRLRRWATTSKTRASEHWETLPSV
jgi:profilin